jgi:hypothetical protein
MSSTNNYRLDRTPGRTSQERRAVGRFQVRIAPDLDRSRRYGRPYDEMPVTDTARLPVFGESSTSLPAQARRPFLGRPTGLERT